MSPIRKLRMLMMRAMPFMITCAEVEGFIVDYLDGELPGRQRFLFNYHIRACPECRAFLVAYKRTIALGKAVFDEPDAPVPDDVPPDLVRAILAAREEDD